MTRLALPPPDPYTGPNPCPRCAGRGLAAEQYGRVAVSDAPAMAGCCPFCHGRRWIAVAAFPRDASTVIYLRLPCDRARELLVEVPA